MGSEEEYGLRLRMKMTTVVPPELTAFDGLTDSTIGSVQSRKEKGVVMTLPA